MRVNEPLTSRSPGPLSGAPGPPSMDTHPDESLRVDVKLLGEPCLWCWEIVDTKQGVLVESSWTSQWKAYESSQDALWAGILRLAELSRRSRGALLQGRRAPKTE